MRLLRCLLICVILLVSVIASSSTAKAEERVVFNDIKLVTEALDKLSLMERKVESLESLNKTLRDDQSGALDPQILELKAVIKLKKEEIRELWAFNDKQKRTIDLQGHTIDNLANLIEKQAIGCETAIKAAKQPLAARAKQALEFIVLGVLIGLIAL